MLITEGKSNRSIADELVMSERAVEGHVSNILTKLGFQSRFGALSQKHVLPAREPRTFLVFRRYRLC